MQNNCVICGEFAKGYNFGVLSCPACCAFFRRTVRLKKNYICQRGGKCIIGGQYDNYKCSACRFQKCNAAGMDARSVQMYRDAIRKSKPSIQSISDTESQTSSNSDKLVSTEIFKPPGIVMGILKDTYNTLNYRRKLFYAKSKPLSLFNDGKMECCELEHYTDGILQLHFTEPRFCSAIINENVQFLNISNANKKEMLASFASHFQALEDLYLSWKFSDAKDTQFWVFPNKQYMNLNNFKLYFNDKTENSIATCFKNKIALKIYNRISSNLFKVIDAYFTRVHPTHNEFIFLFGLILYDPTIENITNETRELLQNLRDQLIKEFSKLCKSEFAEPEIRLADVLLLLTGVKYYEKRLREDMLALRRSEVIPFDYLFDEIWVIRSA